VENPFYLMAPEWARLPLVLIATAATIIASQAVISGAFSVTHQAIQLGFLPRLRTLHTSEKAAGQIYIPAINWGLLAMVLVLVLGFGESTRLASAYGISVVGTMLITTVMLGFLVFQVWRWNRWLASRHDRPVPAGRRRLLSPRTRPRFPTAAGSRCSSPACCSRS
jgi:KUP system potassium uptake protein